MCLSIEAIEETKFEEGAGKIRPINENGSSGVMSDGTAPAHTNGTPSNEEIGQKQSQVSDRFTHLPSVHWFVNVQKCLFVFASVFSVLFLVCLPECLYAY